MTRLKQGLFITIEGGEGSGKSTVIEYLKENLGKEYDVLVTREPGGTKAAEDIRKCIFDNFEELGPTGQLFLYSAARYCDTRDNIIPALKKGYIVLADRYCLSTIIYQGLIGNIVMRDVTEVNRMASLGLKPDLEILLDVDAKTGLARVKSRDVSNVIDEMPTMFHENVNNFYKHHTYGNRRVIIDANKDLEFVQAESLRACDWLIQLKNGKNLPAQ